VTLYLSLHIFTGGSSTDVLGSNAMGQVREFVRLATENNGAKRSAFPPFTLSCRGHQTGYASLIRKKVERIQREKGEKGEEKSRKTRRRHRSRSRQAASAGRRNRQTTSAGRRDRQTTSAGRRDRQTKKRED
jgi:hypothetical protein